MKKIILPICVFFVANASAKSLVDSAQFYFEKGMTEQNAKRFLVASTYFTKAVKLKPTFTEAYIENGNAFLEMRKTDDAKASFTKAYELQPNNSKVIKELATLYYNYRQWDKAIEFINKCSDCPNKEKLVGMCNYEKENYLEAEKYLIKAIVTNPNDAQVNYSLARNYMEMESYKKAVPFFEKAVLLEPTKTNWGYELGLLYYNNNNFKSASIAFENVLKNGFVPNNDFNENYGYSLIYSGQFAAGEQKLLDIYKKKGNKELLREIAQILYDQKQYERSLDYCQRLLELDAKDGKALYQAGLTFIKLGKKDKGQAMCDKAIEFDPTLASKKSAVGDNSAGL